MVVVLFPYQSCCTIPGIFKWVESATVYKTIGVPDHYMYISISLCISTYRYVHMLTNDDWATRKY